MTFVDQTTSIPVQTTLIPVQDAMDSSDSSELNPNPYCLKSGDNLCSVLVTELLIDASTIHLGHGQ